MGEIPCIYSYDGKVEILRFIWLFKILTHVPNFFEKGKRNLLQDVKKPLATSPQREIMTM